MNYIETYKIIIAEASLKTLKEQKDLFDNAMRSGSHPQMKEIHKMICDKIAGYKIEIFGHQLEKSGNLWKISCVEFNEDAPKNLYDIMQSLCIDSVKIMDQEVTLADVKKIMKHVQQ